MDHSWGALQSDGPVTCIHTQQSTQGSTPGWQGPKAGLFIILLCIIMSEKATLLQSLIAPLETAYVRPINQYVSYVLQELHLALNKLNRLMCDV